MAGGASGAGGGGGTANNLMTAEGIDNTTRMAVLGHESEGVNLRYDHVAAGRIAAALDTLEQRLKGA